MLEIVFHVAFFVFCGFMGRWLIDELRVLRLDSQSQLSDVAHAKETMRQFEIKKRSELSGLLE